MGTGQFLGVGFENRAVGAMAAIWPILDKVCQDSAIISLPNTGCY